MNFLFFYKKILANIKKNCYNDSVKLGIIPNFNKGDFMKNYSRQREEIINVIKDSYEHPTAEMVYMTVKSKDPAVSRSTVYRNLGLLVENGFINKISMIVGPDRYDYIRDVHNHVVCTKCGKIFDVDFDFKYKKLKEKIMEKTGIEISEKGITLEGLCDSCKNKI